MRATTIEIAKFATAAETASSSAKLRGDLICFSNSIRAVKLVA
jgi:hypothetical protein